jgi:exodeoxyribonuclease VII small subunit
MAETAPVPDIKAPEIKTMSFEEALDELDGIVRQLEAGRFRLDESISAYERGAALRRHCEAKLSEAKTKVERIALAADGTVEVGAQNLD